MQAGEVDVALAVVSPGLPPLTWGQVLTAWTYVPSVLMAVGVLGLAYVLGVRRLRRVGVAWPRYRLGWFLVGLGSILLVTVSFVGTYDRTLFWDRAVQNIVLLMIAPMFLAMGAPLTLLRDVLPDQVRRRAGRLLRSSVARTLTFPVVVTAALIAPLFVVYLTPLYEASLRWSVVAAVVRVGLVTAGFVYFWTRFRIDPTPRADPYLLSMAISIAEVIFDGVLGLILWLGPVIAPHYYQALHRDWGPGMRLDQIIGAGVLWIGGDLAGLPFLAIVMIRMMREDQRQAAAVDAELDAFDAASASAIHSPPVPGTTAGNPPSPSEPAPARARLWWEDHPEISQRFRRPG